MPMIKLLSILALCIGVANAELFTAMADMDRLLHMERDVVNVISQYVELEQKRLKRLSDFAKDYQKKNQEALEAQSKLGMDYVTHPINAYLLIKRLTSDWQYVENMMNHNNAKEFLQNITNQRDRAMVKFPDQEDLNGAATALLRLQDTYNLETSEIADGRLNNWQKATPLEAHDCFELGRIAYNQADYYHTLMWMEEAIARLDHEDPPSASEAEILEYLAFAMYRQGNVKIALALTKRLKRMQPNHPRAKGNIKHYEAALMRQGESRRKGDDGDLPEPINIRKIDNFVKRRDIYEALCRGDIQKSEAEKARLYCYYKSDRPFLSIAPIKVEVVHWKPKVVVFRQVVHDSEIEVIKQLAAPKLVRATVLSSKTGRTETASYRVSKSCWLDDTDHPVIAQISKRVDLMTNLEMSNAENLQIANYGLGGHYEPHFDFAPTDRKDAFPMWGGGNRIATVLFYLSQPIAGGATVFPELNLTLFPTVHDAAFWFNLYKSGEHDNNTRHAACPVLAGVKWVSNKWIHEDEQEPRRPCGLDPMEYE